MHGTEHNARSTAAVMRASAAATAAAAADEGALAKLAKSAPKRPPSATVVSNARKHAALGAAASRQVHMTYALHVRQ